MVILGGVALFVVVAIVIGYFLWRRSNISYIARASEEAAIIIDTREPNYMDDEFERWKGPQRIPYHRLAAATENFNEENGLGVGGFGTVYRGFLCELNLEVAIKRFSKESKQGIKEYISEVKIICQLRHKNLVPLVGWCHEGDELLLVYEFMPNGSLDAHLFGNKPPLLWSTRYNIAKGLAAALLYLHTESDQCVVHRDIKSSNVLLDGAFNVRLGDFGLARLLNHNTGMKTTVMAGTPGYMAPECLLNASKVGMESDVYSFGIVLLEIACGRRPIVQSSMNEGQEKLVDWVWDLYGCDRTVEAADPRLEGEFNEGQMERLMLVGLWCANPNLNARPAMKQALAALDFEQFSMPSLPRKMPVLSYLPAPDSSVS